MVKSTNKAVIFLSLLLYFNTGNTQNELLIDFADSPGATKTTMRVVKQAAGQKHSGLHK